MHDSISQRYNINSIESNPDVIQVKLSKYIVFKIYHK